LIVAVDDDARRVKLRIRIVLLAPGEILRRRTSVTRNDKRFKETRLKSAMDLALSNLVDRHSRISPDFHDGLSPSLELEESSERGNVVITSLANYA